MEKAALGENTKYSTASVSLSLSFSDRVLSKISLATQFSASGILYTSKEQENIQVFLLINLAEF